VLENAVSTEVAYKMIDVVRRCVTAVAPSHADHSPANCLHVPSRFSDIPDKLLIQLKM